LLAGFDPESDSGTKLCTLGEAQTILEGFGDRFGSPCDRKSDVISDTIKKDRALAHRCHGSPSQFEGRL